MRLPSRPARSAEPAVTRTSVNLLSPWVLEELRIRELRRRLALGAAAALVLVAGGWGWQHTALGGAQDDLAAEQAAGAVLQQRIEGLAPVRTYVDGVQLRAADVQDSMRTEVSFSRVLLDLQDSLPPGVSVDQLSVSLLPTDVTGTPAPDAAATTATGTTGDAATDPDADLTRGLSGAACPGPDPFDTTPAIGCVTISGTAVDRAAVGRMVQRLSRRNAFSEPFVDTTTTSGTTAGSATGVTGVAGAEDPAVTFAGTVGITPAVFTGRYDDLPVDLGLEETP